MNRFHACANDARLVQSNIPGHKQKGRRPTQHKSSTANGNHDSKKDPYGLNVGNCRRNQGNNNSKEYAYYTPSNEYTPGKALGKAGGKQGESGVCFGESGLSGSQKTICFIVQEPTEVTTESPLYNIIKENSLGFGSFFYIWHAQRAGALFPHILPTGQRQVLTRSPIDVKKNIQATSRSRI